MRGIVVRSRGFWLATGLVAAATTFFVVNAMLVNPPVDFLVYRIAAETFLAGGNVYDGYLHGTYLPPEGMPFTYTPFAVVVMIPTVLAPWQVSYAIWTAGSLAVIAWIINRLTPEDTPNRAARVVVMMLAALATSVVLHHLIYGQVNLFLMTLVLADTLRRPDSKLGKIVPPGALIGIAAAIKLTPALFLVFFLITKQWRKLLWGCVGAAATTLIAGAVAPKLSWDFWTTVIWSLEHRVDFTGQMFATSGNNSLRGFLAAAATRDATAGLILCALVGVLGLCAAWWVHRGGQSLESIIIIGLLAPMLSPISWIHHWVYLIPAGTILLTRARGNVRAIAALVAVWLLIVISPSAGDPMLASGNFAITVLGWPLRESLLIASIGAIAALTFVQRSRRYAELKTGPNDMSARTGTALRKPLPHRK